VVSIRNFIHVFGVQRLKSITLFIDREAAALLKAYVLTGVLSGFAFLLLTLFLIPLSEAEGMTLGGRFLKAFSGLASSLFVASVSGIAILIARYQIEYKASRYFWSRFLGSRKIFVLLPRRSEQKDIYKLLPPGEVSAMVRFSHIYEKLSCYTHPPELAVFEESIPGGDLSPLRASSLSLLILGGPTGNNAAAKLWKVLGIKGKPLVWEVKEDKISIREACSVSIDCNNETHTLYQELPISLQSNCNYQNVRLEASNLLQKEAISDPFVIISAHFQDDVASKMLAYIRGDDEIGIKLSSLSIVNIAGCSAWGTASAAWLIFDEQNLRVLFETLFGDDVGRRSTFAGLENQAVVLMSLSKVNAISTPQKNALSCERLLKGSYDPYTTAVLKNPISDSAFKQMRAYTITVKIASDQTIEFAKTCRIMPLFATRPKSFYQAKGEL